MSGRVHTRAFFPGRHAPSFSHHVQSLRSPLLVHLFFVPTAGHLVLAAVGGHVAMTIGEDVGDVGVDAGGTVAAGEDGDGVGAGAGDPVAPFHSVAGSTVCSSKQLVHEDPWLHRSLAFDPLQNLDDIPGYALAN